MIPKTIEIIFCDVDGVLTDGNLLISNDGSYSKSFNTKDGYGIIKAIQAGIHIYWITGRRDPATQKRAKELGCPVSFVDGEDKSVAVQKILAELNISKENSVFIGDDIPDLSVLPYVGYFTVPRDAHYKVKEKAHMVMSKPGGAGAVRELIDIILDE
ncbi:HAD hydrolase family protein [Candidatus Calescamantes bacterium]|nr:HAD hydrolase family protein [Candidatus Calescamantes bacterium]MCK5598355.1 HAD hydrolase family protein [bacterium]